MKPAGSFRRKFGRLVLAIVLTIVLGWGLYRVSTWMFTIHTIEVVGGQAIVQIDETRISKNLLFFPSETLREDVLSDNPWLFDVRFEKRFPGTLRIVPTRRKPIAILESGGRAVYVSREGVILSDGDSLARLPRVTITINPFRVGETITDKRVLVALSLIDGLAETIEFTKITYENGGYLQATSGTLDIIVAQDRPSNETIATLQTLLSGFRIKGTLPAVVDLRFDKPVVTF